MMTLGQGLLFGLIVAILALFAWGRIRYDLVALGGLLVAVVLGLVPSGEAFAGFGHPATVTVAMVLVVSAGLARSGAIQFLTQPLIRAQLPEARHIAVMGGIGGVMSGFMNNVAALALLMPVDRQAARKARRAAGRTLMPLSFACILGGMVTLIGTPPNIIVATIRGDELGESFAMFDFAPVGGVVALAGIAFVALIGWRLLPERGEPVEEGRAALSEFIAELYVAEDSKIIGKRVRDFESEAEAADVAILAVLRGGRKRFGAARHLVLAKGDVLLVEAAPEGLEEFRATMKLDFPADDSVAGTAEALEREGGPSPLGKAGLAKRRESRRAGVASGEGMVLIEAVVQPGARIEGKTAHAVGLSWRHQTVLMGISRRGRTIRDRVRRTEVEAGDILLLLVPEETQAQVTEWLGALPLARRGQPVIRGDLAFVALGLFALAIAAASFELVAMPVALGFVVIGYVLSGVLSARELYTHIDWPVIVLLGALLPVGAALDEMGTTAEIARALELATGALPAWSGLAILMTVTMLLSAVLNNNATAVIAAPIGIRMAEQGGTNPDAFLMAVAVGASCAFLTPIAHQNNTLVMGPGGYRFNDYWRMGLPLSVLVIAVAVPAILVFWPL